ncbi:O-antigen ligase family protein [Bradyrhizobium sp. WD16]|nr:O-antigen ligase family protein [Bradyrhizobium sp. WD16]
MPAPKCIAVTQPSLTSVMPALVRHLRRQRLADTARMVVFTGTLLLVWVSLKPFADLTNMRLEDVGTGNDFWTYVWFLALALLAPAMARSANSRGLVSLATASFLTLMGWMVLTVLLSLDPATSIRRFTLTACVVATAAALLLVPKSRQELTRWTLAAALIVLVLCFAGVILMPHLSIHQATDVQEPQLAGDWRGSFGHKNVAAAVMAMLVFIGIYGLRSRAVIAGGAVTGLSAVFLLFTHGKSSLGLLILVLAVSLLVPRLRSLWSRAAVCLAPLALINALSVGTVLSPALAAIAGALPFDTSFTGRTDIWRFAAESIATRPLTGYGFSAFWGSKIMGTPDPGLEWATEAAHSHNGYLDAGLTMGLPGLALVILVLVIGPLRDYHLAERRGHGGPLNQMFLQIWLFGIYLASMESFFLDRADPIWFNLLLAVFGLHYLARFRTIES